MQNLSKHLSKLSTTFLFLFLYLGQLSQAANLPNLQLYTPTRWSDNLVLANINNQIKDTSLSTKYPQIYLTLAVANYSFTDYNSNSTLSLYVDNQLINSAILAPISAGTYFPITYPLNNYCPGEHTLRVELDSSQQINESNESDNSYSQIFSISGDRFNIFPDKNNFGDIPLGQTSFQRFLISHDGCESISLKTAVIIGANNRLFKITKNECSSPLFFSHDNSYNSTCMLEISFSPDSIGGKASSLQVTTDALSSPITTIPLTGRGVLGDFDTNGRINIGDIITVLKIIANNPTTNQPSLSQDIVINNRLDLIDAISLIDTISRQTTAQTYKIVRINTRLGDILIWLYAKTPRHRNNFLSLVANGFYNSLLFHRVIDGFMIQGGDPEGTGSGGPGYTIPAEIDSSLTHVYGAVAAARLANSINPEKNSSGSQFYIVENLSGTHSLDGEYTVFGQVISGMPIIEAFANVPKDTKDKPLRNLVILRADIVLLTAQQLIDTYEFSVPTD